MLCQKLQAIADGDIRRLMVCMPPGSAKSTYASKLFPAWFLSQGTGLNIIGASNTAELASSLSRECQGYIREEKHVLGYELARESAELWTTTNGGQYRSAGVGGTITGFRGDLAIVDDPVKSRSQADSILERDNAWNWYNADLMTRLKPSGRVVLIMTRWHEDDLGGRLLQTQKHLWDILYLPATALEYDPLGRKPGEMLWSDGEYGYGRRLKEAREEAELNGAMRDWFALYEQDPRPLDGGLFQTNRIPIIDEPPKIVRSYRGWDLAASAQVGTRNPDWTVGVKIGVTEEGRFVVLDVFRNRGGPEDVENWVRGVAEIDGRSVPISVPQDPGAAGKAQAIYMVRRLPGFAVKASTESGDKSTRAMPLSSQCNVGNVAVLKRHWTNAYIEELRGFPSGAKDDQVDASSRAFNALTQTAGFQVQRLGY